MSEVQSITPTPAPIAGIGHNIAPPEIAIRADLEERYRNLKPRAAQLIEDAEAIPEDIPESMAEKIADFLKTVREHIAQIKAAKKLEKTPYLIGAAVIENYFAKLREPMDELKDRIVARYEITLNRKEARLRKEAEDRKRIERERLEAERKRAEAEAKAEEDRLNEQRRIAAEAEAQRKRDAEERERIRQEELRKHEAERKRIEDEAATLERVRIAREAEISAAKAKRDKELRLLREQEAEKKAAAERMAEDEAEKRRLAAIEGRQDQRRSKQAEAAEAEAIEQQEKIVERSEVQAQRAENREFAAAAQEKAIANAPAAQFARTRGDWGGMGTLREKTTFANIDRATLDLEKLRPHIPMDALEQAVRGFIDAGGTRCAGVDIFEINKLVSR